MKWIGTFSAAGVFVLGLLQTANATILPGAVVAEQGTDVSGTYSNGSGSISMFGTLPNAPSGGSGSISLTYWVEVVGPSSVTVPLDFSTSGTTYVDAHQGRATVSADLGTFSLEACSNGGESEPCSVTSSGPPSFSATQLYSIASNTPVEVELSGSWTGQCCGDGYFGGAAAGGSVNSSVAIDSSFTTSGYSLVTSPVPLPESFWLLLSGCVLGFFVVRPGSADGRKSV